jgi:hypothetical protein
MSTAIDMWSIEESGPLVKIDKRNLPDLDDLMLDILMRPEVHQDALYEWEPLVYGVTDDIPTRIPSAYGEGLVGYYRKNPCACGDGHGFDLGEVPMDDDGKPVGRAARGAFMGVYFA